MLPSDPHTIGRSHRPLRLERDGAVQVLAVRKILRLPAHPRDVTPEATALRARFADGRAVIGASLETIRLEDASAESAGASAVLAADAVGAVDQRLILADASARAAVSRVVFGVAGVVFRACVARRIGTGRGVEGSIAAARISDTIGERDDVLVAAAETRQADDDGDSEPFLVGHDPFDMMCAHRATFWAVTAQLSVPPMPTQAPAQARPNAIGANAKAKTTATGAARPSMTSVPTIARPVERAASRTLSAPLARATR